MAPGAVVGEGPEFLLRQVAQVRHHGGQHVGDPVVDQRAGEVVVIDHEQLVLRPLEDRDHVVAQKRLRGLVGLLPPALALLLDLTITDGHLGGAKIVQTDGGHAGFAGRHGLASKIQVGGPYSQDGI